MALPPVPKMQVLLAGDLMVEGGQSTLSLPWRMEKLVNRDREQARTAGDAEGNRNTDPTKKDQSSLTSGDTRKETSKGKIAQGAVVVLGDFHPSIALTSPPVPHVQDQAVHRGEHG